MRRTAATLLLVALLLTSYAPVHPTWMEGEELSTPVSVLDVSGRAASKGFLIGAGTTTQADAFTSVAAHTTGSVAAIMFADTLTYGSSTLATSCPYAGTQLSPGPCDVGIVSVSEGGSYGWGTTIDASNGLLASVSVAAGGAGEAIAGGQYAGGLVFNPASQNQPFSQNFEGWVAKTDPMGNWLWAVGYSTIDGGFGAQSSVLDVATDMQGNVYVTGYFIGETDFGGQSVNVSDLQAFIAKYDRQTGNLGWVTPVGGLGNDIGVAIETTPMGNIVVSMLTASATVNAANTLHSLIGTQDAILLELDGSGTILTMNGFGVANEATSISNLAVNGGGDVYMAGSFKGTLTVPAGSVTASQGKADLFVMQMPASGSGGWITSAGSSENDSVSGMGVTSTNDLVLATTMSASSTFGSKSVLLHGGSDAVLAGLSGSGVWTWAQRVSTTSNDYAFDLAVNMSDEAIMVGGFGGTLNIAGKSISTTGGVDGMIFGFDPTTLLDTDNDGVPDVNDNCPTVSNADQANTDLDSEGDACDSDDDNDGLTDNFPDLCPRNSQFNWTSMQDLADPAASTDWDNDGCHDGLEDDDDDNDGVSDVDDQCQFTSYAPPRPTWVSNETNDLDGDGCRDVDEDLDDDGDGWEDAADSCPLEAGNATLGSMVGCPDLDMDGWADVVDDCPDLAGNSTANGTNACPDQDGDGWADAQDAFVADPTQWSDTDGDGFGDAVDGNQPDACPTVAGTSTVDRFGCVDPDADGRSSPDSAWGLDDGADAFPTDPAQWSDYDGDGLGDNHNDPDWSDRNPSWPGEYLAIVGDYDRCPAVPGTSSKLDIMGCPDPDGDGYANEIDAFQTEATQWQDLDGDGYGDNASGVEPDACPDEAGNSTEDRYGCTDYDGDGWSDPFDGEGLDVAPDDPTQWSDRDGDLWFDNPDGNFADMCPDAPTAVNVQTRLEGIDRQGCPDSDFDGYSDPDAEWTVDMGADACPDAGYDASVLSTQDRFGCLDTDGDGWSDPDQGWTVEMGADAFPEDPTKWEPEAEEGTDGASSAGRTVLMVGGLLLVLAGMGAAVALRGRSGSVDVKAPATMPPGLGMPDMHAQPFGASQSAMGVPSMAAQPMGAAVAVPNMTAQPVSTSVAMPPGLAPAQPTAPVEDPAARSYYDGLLAQGYDPASAKTYTQQYFPNFQG